MMMMMTVSDRLRPVAALHLKTDGCGSVPGWWCLFSFCSQQSWWFNFLSSISPGRPKVMESHINKFKVQHTSCSFWSDGFGRFRSSAECYQIARPATEYFKHSSVSYTLFLRLSWGVDIGEKTTENGAEAGGRRFMPRCKILLLLLLRKHLTILTRYVHLEALLVWEGRSPQPCGQAAETSEGYER